MATISTGGGARTRKSLNIDVPLVPFLDLLLCCVMFLLVTAVWNELGALNVSQQMPGTGIDLPSVPSIEVMLRVGVDGYVLSSTAGDRQELAGHDAHGLEDLLRARRAVDAPEQPLVIMAEDGVAYAELTAAMDVARSTGYMRLQVSGASD